MLLLKEDNQTTRDVWRDNLSIGDAVDFKHPEAGKWCVMEVTDIQGGGLLRLQADDSPDECTGDHVAERKSPSIAPQGSHTDSEKYQAALNERIDTVRSSLGGLNGELELINAKIREREAEAEAARKNFSENIANLQKEMNSGVQALNSKVTTLEEGLKTTEAKLNALEASQMTREQIQNLITTNVPLIMDPKIEELRTSIGDKCAVSSPESEKNAASFDWDSIVSLVDEKMEFLQFQDGTGEVDRIRAVRAHSGTFTSADPWEAMLAWAMESPTDLASSGEIVLHPVRRAGDCWPMSGDNGWMIFQLYHATDVTHFLVEHISQSITAYPESTPNKLSLDVSKDMSEWSRVQLKTNVFDSDGDNAQSFKLERPEQAKGISFVRLNIESNYGHEDYTCLYRVRVHGEKSQE